MSDEGKLREYLKRVTVDLHDARLRLRELEQQGGEPIAIVGMACRYPGGIDSPERLWEMVRDGRDAIGECPADRGWKRETHRSELDRADGGHVRDGGFLDDAGEFDSDFFSINPREALAMDPQQRLLLEVSWEAIERAGIDPLALKESETGVFVGGATNGYGLNLPEVLAERLAGYHGSGTLSSVMSGRISYTLGLEGPAITLDTACSSSLVALHLACGSLRSQECSLALVGGVNVMPTPATFEELARQGGLSPEGRCKSFSESADGTGWGEGAGILLLERLSDALEQGHHVLALARGSAVNQDGASNGLTAPNGPAQQRVIRQALLDAGLVASQIDAVEAHGTGTTLGDPIEAHALLATYGRDRAAERPLWLGSIKSNIGHTQAAAGIAGVIKMVMALRHELLPATLHVGEPSRQVDWSSGSVELLREQAPWPRLAEPRRAGVSSFGVSGTNAHVIIEEAPRSEVDSNGPDEHVSPGSPHTRDEVPVAAGHVAKTGLLRNGVQPLILSAREDVALRGQAHRLVAFVDGGGADLEMVDVGRSLTRRSAFEHRAVSTGADRSELTASLEAIAGGVSGAGVIKGKSRADGAGGTVFVFPGQGSQWTGMALELMDCSSLFAHVLSECGEAFEPYIDWSVQDVLRGLPGAPSIERIEVVQPVLFSIMVALARLWEACGVRPQAVVGHSQGEIAAAHIAGGLSLPDAAKVVGLRSQMFTALAGAGGVASVALGVEEVRALIAPWEDRMSIAGVNGPRSVAVAGDRESLTEFLGKCASAEVRAREVPATVASHSIHVEGLRDELLEVLSSITPGSGEIAFYSTVTGGLFDTAQLDAQYWYRNLREPVEFERATRALLADGYRTLVEVSAHPVLTMGLHETVLDAYGQNTGSETAGPAGDLPADAGQSTGIAIQGTLRRGDGGPQRFLRSLSELWVGGVEVDWNSLFAEVGAKTVQLPTYAFQRRRYWLEPAQARGDLTGVGQRSIGHPLVGAAVERAQDGGWLVTGRISLQDQPWFADHVVSGLAVVPGTTFVEVALHVGAELGCGALEDLVFETPLVLRADGGVQLQVTLEAPDESGRRALAIYSLAEGEAGDEEDESSWTRHARGLLGSTSQDPREMDAELQRQESSFAVGAWPPAGAQPVDVDELYDYFAGVGLEYGPNFLCVQNAWRRGEEAFTEVRLDESQDDSAGLFGIHPALLDCALQAGGVLMRGDHAATPENAVLPFAWSRVRLYARGHRSLQVRLARLKDGGFSLLASDEQGRLVLSAESVVVRKIVPGQLPGQAGGAHRSLFHLEWVPVQIAEPHAEPMAGRKGVAVLGDRALEMVGGRGEGPGEQDLPLIAHADLSALSEAIEDGHEVPELVLMWLGQDEPAGSSQAQPALTRELAELALRNIQKWLSDERLSGSRFVLLTSGAVSIGEQDEIGDLAAAPLWGLIRSAQSEHPGRFVLADLGDAESVSLDVLLGALDSDESQLALRGERVLGARLTRVAGQASRPTRFAPGTVLVTGGTGALGALLARHLVEHHGVSNLVLVSRQGEQAPGASRLKTDLAALGAEVRIAACDVSDREQLAKLIDSVGSEHPLSAVIHAAGALQDGLIDAMTRERLAQVMAPKADAAWHLHELTQELELSAFILYSSSTGTLGGPGQGNYAAANVFLDSLAAYRRARGLAGVSIGWGLWADAGSMASELSDADRVRMQRSGMLAMSAEEGLALFDLACEMGEPLVIPARLDASGLRAQSGGGPIPSLLRSLVRPGTRGGGSQSGSLSRRIAGTPEEERERVVLDLVRAEVASVLGHDSPESIDVHRAFNELGFDSLTAVELRNRLSDLSGIQLPATLAFDYPSTEALSRFLLERAEPREGRSAERDLEEADVQNAIASIPLGRLREAGVMDTLLALAGLGGDSGSSAEAESPDSVDEMDLESLVELTLGSEQAVGEPVEGG